MATLAQDKQSVGKVALGKVSDDRDATLTACTKTEWLAAAKKHPEVAFQGETADQTRIELCNDATDRSAACQ
jgi:hypothetical protein